MLLDMCGVWFIVQEIVLRILVGDKVICGPVSAGHPPNWQSADSGHPP